jgi:hypothetical protein
LRKSPITALFIFLFSTQAFGEYRVYQYYVRPKIQNIVTVSAELVTSTLNPVAYIAYHGGNESVEVNLLRSWQCMGNTSKEPVCSVSEGKELNGVAQ